MILQKSVFCFDNRIVFVGSGITNNSDCIDVCTKPICGTSDNLTLLAPVVYDEIGINLCREVPLHAGRRARSGQGYLQGVSR